MTPNGDTASRRDFIAEGAVATALSYHAYRRRYALGVTPDGEVVGRRADAQLAAVDHVVHVAGYSGPPSLASFVEQAARDRAGWIERHLNITLADWQVEILRGQYEGWAAVLRRQTEQMARAATGLAPLLEEMGRADAVTALQPLAKSLAPPKPPADARERALHLRRNRNTGPSTSARAPRAINPRRGR
jgi:hypothetical protein